MKLLAFAASRSSTSINKQLVTYAASLVPNATVEILDINDYEMPLFSQDKEVTLGLPPAAKAFYQKLGQADAIVVSFAEHNGSYTAAYKNLFDWTTRIDMKIFQHKPVVFLATSPGPGGAESVLSAATASAHFFAADVKASVSVPSFYDNYDSEKQQITNPAIVSELSSALAKLNN